MTVNINFYVLLEIMMNKIKDFLGEISGYKQKYLILLRELKMRDEESLEAEKILDEIIHTLVNWHVIK